MNAKQMIEAHYTSWLDEYDGEIYEYIKGDKGPRLYRDFYQEFSDAIIDLLEARIEKAGSDYFARREITEAQVREIGKRSLVPLPQGSMTLELHAEPADYGFSETQSVYFSGKLVYERRVVPDGDSTFFSFKYEQGLWTEILFEFCRSESPRRFLPIGKLFETSEIAKRNLLTSVRSKLAISECAQEHALGFSPAVLDKLKLERNLPAGRLFESL